MANLVPQYADIELSFENIKYNITPTTVDLSIVDDIILSVSSRSPTRDPILTLKKSVVPTRFTVDNVNKTVKVTLTSDEVGDVIGKYYVNLWIQEDNRFVTHLVLNFDVQAAVNYVVSS